ncbi:metallophosphoesterase [Bacteroides fragilis]|uniref:metallophosphoesterase n=1 Tax=Bacteroides fragilis TaxID=817 RepID=UPI002030754E|nr:metallophosphoesterase [Bacteroides fragilis]MCM0217996.1 metallophosphoesterase [Bacteroides fragilis]MCM0267813.1 metallophosphoesterase [Bacteroides fragilis]
MNIQFVSDLHLEIPRNAQYFQKEKIIPFADILILAGDTMCWDEGYLQDPFWDEISSTFAQVLVIPGNHEFYKGYDLASLRKSASGIIRDNIHWYYNQSVVIDGVQIILSTLWSQIPSDISERIRNCCNDFTCIQYGGVPITIDKYNDENRFCRDYISKELEKKYSKRIIVSHHVPILEVISEQLQNSWYPALYANNLDELIRDNTIDYWIYGHSHQCRKSYRLHDTELVTNPCGYISKKENSQFDSNSIISI